MTTAIVGGLRGARIPQLLELTLSLLQTLSLGAMTKILRKELDRIYHVSMWTKGHVKIAQLLVSLKDSRVLEHDFSRRTHLVSRQLIGGACSPGVILESGYPSSSFVLSGRYSPGGGARDVCTYP